MMKMKKTINENILNLEKLTYDEIVNLFIALKTKRGLEYDDKIQLYQLADILIDKYEWNINDEAFLGMYEDDEMESIFD